MDRHRTREIQFRSLRSLEFWVLGSKFWELSRARIINRYVCRYDIVRVAHEKIRTLKACGYATARMDARNTNRDDGTVNTVSVVNVVSPLTVLRVALTGH